MQSACNQDWHYCLLPASPATQLTYTIACKTVTDSGRLGRNILNRAEWHLLVRKSAGIFLRFIRADGAGYLSAIGIVHSYTKLIECHSKRRWNGCKSVTHFPVRAGLGEERSEFRIQTLKAKEKEQKKQIYTEKRRRKLCSGKVLIQ